MSPSNIVVLATILLIGCGGIRDEGGDASIVTIDPSPNSRLRLPITITFDDIPRGVTLTGTPARSITWNLQGNTLTITNMLCYFEPPSSDTGHSEVYLEWDTGAQHISYTCRKPPPPPPSAANFSADPPCGSTVPGNAIVSVRFDQPVKSVNVAGATGSGRNWKIPISANMNFTWINRDGSEGGPAGCYYTTVAPDHVFPKITGGSVTHGENRVDPKPLNDNEIVITLSENVVGTVELLFKDRQPAGWRGRVSGKTAVLFPVAGKELTHSTTYIIVIKVRDAAGNEAEFTIEFRTKAKE